MISNHLIFIKQNKNIFLLLIINFNPFQNFSNKIIEFITVIIVIKSGIVRDNMIKSKSIID